MDQMVVVCQAVRRGRQPGAGQRRLPVRAAAGGSGRARCGRRSGWSRRPASTWSSSTARPTTWTRSGRRRAPASRCSPSSASRRRRRCGYGVEYTAMARPADAACRRRCPSELVAEAKALEDAGAALLNFTNSGPVVGAAVAAVGVDPGARRLRRRPVARRPDADGARGDRLRRRRPSTTRRTRTRTSPGSRFDAMTRVRGRRPGGAPDPRRHPGADALSAHCRRSTASPPATR